MKTAEQSTDTIAAATKRYEAVLAQVEAAGPHHQLDEELEGARQNWLRATEPEYRAAARARFASILAGLTGGGFARTR